jgi:hypothetical protein
MRNTFKWATLIVICLTFTACGILDPQQQSDMLSAINTLEEAGHLTPAMAAVQRELVTSNGIGPIWQQGLGYALAALSAYFGIQLKRGPSERLVKIANKKAAKSRVTAVA